jgi:hypothetical protein
VLLLVSEDEGVCVARAYRVGGAPSVGSPLASPGLPPLPCDTQA